MKRILVIVKTRVSRHQYTGLFRSSMDAAQDAVLRFGICSVVAMEEV